MTRDEDDNPLDANGCLKDGRTYRVRMHARDSVQAAIAATEQRIHDGTDNPFALNRPGYRYNDSVDRSESAQAYQTRVLDGQEQWRVGPGSDQLEASALGTEYSGKPGGPCTVRAGAARGWIEGSPGHLAYVSVEGEEVLMCVPDAPSDRRTDSTPILDWRTTDLGKLVRDAGAIKQQAYEAACAERERAWMQLGSQ
jgi:hypothetical protein